MKVAALFQLFWAAATINFGLVIAAPRGPLHNGLSKRTTTYFCDSTAEEVITYSLGEMIEMLTTAINRTLNLMAFLADPPIHINQQGQLLQSTFYTFESIFGKLEYGAGSSENSDAISRVQTLITLAETMRSSVQGILSNQYFEIYCSDAWLISEDRDGDISLINPYLYWDNRVTRTTSLGIDFSTSQGICRDDAAFYAWVNPAMSSSQAPGGQTSVMTLCQNALSGWVSNYQAQNTMKVAAQQTYPDKVSLEIFQGLTLTTALLHEFTHAPAIVGPNYLIDESCDDNGQIKSAYGWFCVAQLAATPSKALNNADSFSFYVTAMYLSLSDWSTGSSVTIPPDTTPADEDGLASMMSKLTLD